MEIKAKARHIKISPKKVRLVVDVIRNLKALDALDQLKYITKAASKPLEKLLKSAVANAENNFEIKKDTLKIKEIRVDEGPTIKRWRPRAYGRATTIRKRTSHVSVVLEGEGDIKKKKKNSNNKKDDIVKVKDLKKGLDNKDQHDHKTSSKKPAKKQSGEKVKKVFQRKSG